MKKHEMQYRKDVAFINREKDMAFLKGCLNERPESILFIHGPKSSGKTTLLYKFLEQTQEEQKLDVKFLDLRKSFANMAEDFFKAFLMTDNLDMKKETPVLFKIDATVKRKLLEKRADPFKVMKAQFLGITQEGIKPVLIIDELQALEEIYFANDKNRLLITALFNFFVAMTKQAHLAHIIIASSDGDFLNTVYNDSKLKKCSRFYKVDYLTREDIMEWLLNLEKYSKIKEYTLTSEDAGKIWDTVGGSMWEIQEILARLFDQPLDEILTAYKREMRGIIAHYTEFDKNKMQVLEIVNKKEIVSGMDFETLPIDGPELKELLRDMVKNNILYFDPTLAVYYPQGKSYRWGIRLYFENL